MRPATLRHAVAGSIAGDGAHVADAPPDGLGIAVDLAGIASKAGDIEARAREVLELLRRLVPFEAASIHLVDPRRREFTPLASIGYNARTH